MSPRGYATADRVEQAASEAGMAPLEWIADQLANAVSLSQVARDLKVDRSALSHYASALPGAPEVLGAAREEGAHKMIEEAMEILDEVNTSSMIPGQAAAELGKARARAEMRMWLAARHNQKSFGDSKGTVNVQINVGEAILEVMRAPVSPRIGKAPEPPTVHEINAGALDSKTRIVFALGAAPEPPETAPEPPAAPDYEVEYPGDNATSCD